MISASKFLIDEDVPVALLKALAFWGHDAVRVEAGGSDLENARRAKKEGRILVTLDKDFLNASLYPPSEFTIVHIRIHPPHKEPILTAFKDLIQSLPVVSWTGLIILQKDGHLHIPA